MIIVEDGSGVENANSYVSALDVHNYCESMNYTDWNSPENNYKVEGSILRAMRYIEAFNFIGTKGQTVNDLEWPRIDAYERNGILIDSGSIPLKIKKAVCEAAYQENISDWSLQPKISAENMKKEDYGSVSFEYFQSKNAQKPVFPSISGILKGLVLSAGTIVRS